MDLLPYEYSIFRWPDIDRPFMLEIAEMEQVSNMSRVSHYYRDMARKNPLYEQLVYLWILEGHHSAIMALRRHFMLAFRYLYKGEDDCLKPVILHSHFATIKWLVESQHTVVRTWDFIEACAHTTVDIVEYLFQHLSSPINYPEILERCFSNAADFGHIDTIKWLKEHCPITNRIQCNILRSTCRAGSMEAAMYLMPNWCYLSDVECSDLFIDMCYYGRLSLAIEFYKRSSITQSYDLWHCFDKTCKSGQLHVLKWLWTLGIPNIRIINDKVLRTAIRYGRKDVTKWLWIHMQHPLPPNIITMKRIAHEHDRLDILNWLDKISKK